MQSIFRWIKKMIPEWVRSRMRHILDAMTARLRFHLLVERCLRVGMYDPLISLEREYRLTQRHRRAIERSKVLLKRQDDIRLELGGGNQVRDGWVNVDIYAEQADLQLDLRRPMPFPDLSIKEIYASHILEHFGYPEELGELLRECFRVLEVGGVFRAAVPDAGRAFRNYCRSEFAFYDQKYWGNPDPNWCKSPMDELNWLIYMGGQHRHMFDKQNLVIRLEEAGFGQVRASDFDDSIDNPLRRHQSLYVEAVKTRENPFSVDQATLCASNDVTAYDALWEDPALTQRYSHPDRILLWRRIADVSIGQPGAVLDIGCGGGHLLEILQKVPGHSGENLCGVDYSARAVEQAKLRVPEANFELGDATRLPFLTGAFDIVICCEVLEHLDNPRQALREAHRVLSPKGMLIITIPNGAKDSYEGHVNFWDKGQFRDFCDEYPIESSETLNKGRALLFVLRKNGDR